MKKTVTNKVATIITCIFAFSIFTLMSKSGIAADNWGLSQYYQPNLCGPIALCCICRSFGIEATIDELTELSDFDGQATSVYGLVKAASAKSLHAETFESSVRHLRTISGPAIVDFPKGHFSVFAGWSGDKLLICDPPQKVTAVDLSHFEEEWQGHLILFSKFIDKD